MIHHPQNERCTLVPQLVYCLDYFKIRKGCPKKTFMFFYYTGGGGVGEAGGSARVVKKPHWFVKEKLFQRACRIILGPQKLVLRLVWSTFAISFDWCSILFVPTIVIWHWEGEPSYKNKNRSYSKKISIDHVAPQTANYDWKWEPCLDLKYIFSLSHLQLFDSFESNPRSPNPKEKEGQYQNKQSVNFLSPVTVVLLPKEKWEYIFSPEKNTIWRGPRGAW